jgi:hypothetical protein
MMYYAIDAEGLVMAAGDSISGVQSVVDLNTGWSLVSSTDEDAFDKRYVEGVFIDIQENIVKSRRNERREEFSKTLDRMNPAWYNSLTDTQKTSLETWRQAWLDYPDTGILPTRIDIFN